jgi:hypothetical protein
MVTMIEWGDRWMRGRAGVPVELIHQPCGHSIQAGTDLPILQIENSGTRNERQARPSS